MVIDTILVIANMKISMMKLLAIGCIFNVCIVTANRLFVHVPSADHINLTRNVRGRFEVLSLSECASLCEIFQCMFMKYDELKHVCIIFGENEKYNLTNMNEVGKVYIQKESKSCYFPGYEYIWELEICVKFYHGRGNKLTWEASQIRCENEAGNLIMVSNQTKNELIIPYLYKQYEKTGLKTWWIGANDNDEEGVFRWVSGEKVTYQYWDSGQPDNFNSNTNQVKADCALFFFRNVNQSFAWFDRSCDSQLGAICENKIFN